MRKKIVAGNWKMNKTLPEAIKLVDEIKSSSDTFKEDVTVIVSPSFPFISAISDSIKQGHRKIYLAAQNCHHEEKGAYTGEVSASMLKSCGVEYVIVGHSERRAYFKEDSIVLSKKMKAVISTNLKPIYCVGETADERKSNRQFDVVKKQISEVLFDLKQEQWSDIVIAYEPVWAIGTGQNASSAQAQEMHKFIRSVVREKHPIVAENISILYGGSCNAQNAAELFACSDVDGGLIGGASLDAGSFQSIINSFPE